MLHTPAQYLARWLPYKLGFGAVTTAFLMALGGLLFTIIPQSLDQLSQLAQELPSAFDAAAQWFAEQTGSRRDGQLMQTIDQEIGEFLGRFVPLAFNLISVVIGSLAVITLAVLLAYEPRVYRDLVIRIAPPKSRASVSQVYEEAGRNLQIWVLGKALTMLMTGVAVWIGLELFGIPGALALASFAAAMEFIPNLGSTIAAGPAVIAAFLISPMTALWVAIYYLLLQQVQTAIMVPFVERRAVNIPAAALLIWQIMMAIGFGIFGLFVATPLLAVVVVAVRTLYIEPGERRHAQNRREGALVGADALRDELAVPEYEEFSPR